MFEEFPVVFAEEESPHSSSSSSSSSSAPPFSASKAMKTLCCKMLRSPKVLRLLAEASDDLLERVDLTAVEYLVKCPGALYGSPGLVLLVLVKKFLFTFVGEAEDLSEAALHRLYHETMPMPTMNLDDENDVGRGVGAECDEDMTLVENNSLYSNGSLGPRMTVHVCYCIERQLQLVSRIIRQW